MDLSSNTVAYIQQKVLAFMSSGISFTSVDIANQAKEAGHFARNRAVAEWLRSNAIPLAHKYSYLYNQTLIRVNSKADGQTLAYLYHEYNSDPDDYLSRDQNPKPYQSSSVWHHGASQVTKNNRSPVVMASRPHHSNFQKRDTQGRFC